MHRALALIVTASLAFATDGATAKSSQPRAHPNDAAAMKALSRYAVKAEACRAKTHTYYECDDGRAPTGIRFVSSTASSYSLAARSRTGRRFTLARASNGKLSATCSPKGRGGCGARGTWKPSPLPELNPPLGEDWLAQERELVRRMLALVEILERCHATTGDYGACRTDELEAARRWDGAYTPQGFGFGIELERSSYTITATSRASTRFTYSRRPDVGVERSCTKLPPVVSPCRDGSW